VFCEGMEEAETPVGKGRWKVYATAASLTPLLRWLNKNGVRESALRVRLQVVQSVMEAAARRRTKEEARDGRKGSAEAKSEKVRVDTPGAEGEPCVDWPSEGNRAVATAARAVGSYDEDGVEAMEGGQEAGPTDGNVERVGRMLLELEAALPPAGVLMVRGGEFRRASWRAFVSRTFGVPLADSDDDFVGGGKAQPEPFAAGPASAEPQDAMAALLVLESMIATPWLRPYWRLWSLPLPPPASTQTWAEVYYRLCALRRAVREGRAAPSRRELDQFEKAAVPIKRPKRQRQPPREALGLDLEAVSGYERRSSRRTRTQRVSYRDVGDDSEEEDEAGLVRRGRGLPETELPGAVGRAARAAQRAARLEGHGRAERALRRTRARMGAGRSDSEEDGLEGEGPGSEEDVGVAKRLHAQLNTCRTRGRS
jgi:hypothetical protein